MVNRLGNASSPYLRQHADNPVEWWEWGPEAFAEAQRRDVPVLLSVGYSTCHWCHVMAHETFSDAAVAGAINERTVPIKVDREERPDVDAVYMTATQALTGHGGWPMTVFTTPAGEPFLAGTYYPPEPRHGMPSFTQVLEAVDRAWRDEREKVVASADQLTAHVRNAGDLGEGADGVHPDAIDRIATAAVRAWDPTDGGFGRAPKFPMAMTLDFLLAHHARTGEPSTVDAALHSLDAMARGGIYDHVGGGFARYSVDGRWLVPHFEKMLYDNALLLRAYTHAWQVARHDPERSATASRCARVVAETATCLLDDFRLDGGGFASGWDADAEGEEGRFHVWATEELTEVIASTGEDADRWLAFFGADGSPTFEGRFIVHEPAARDESDAAFDDAYRRVRSALAQRRATRVHPSRDEKVLTSWNGLAIGALAEAGAVFDQPTWIAAAEEAAAFLADNLVIDGRLLHTFHSGHGASVPALAEDVALLAQGLVVLFEATGTPRWVEWAADLVADADDRFAEEDRGTPTGAYFATAHDAEALITRPKDLWDNATPAPASALADARLRLAALTGDDAHRQVAARIIARFLPRAEAAPIGYGELARAAVRHLATPLEIAIVGAGDDPATATLLAATRHGLHPGLVVAPADPADPADLGVLIGRTEAGSPRAYVCRNHACEAPTADSSAVVAALASD